MSHSSPWIKYVRGKIKPVQSINVHDLQGKNVISDGQVVGNIVATSVSEIGELVVVCKIDMSTEASKKVIEQGFIPVEWTTTTKEEEEKDKSEDD